MTTSSKTNQPTEHPRPQANLDSNDPYAVLGLQRGATARQIKRGYFDLVREYPPEKEVEAFKIIRAAYEKLRNPDVKASTDLFLFRPPSPWSPRKRKGKLDLDFSLADLIADLQRRSDLGRTDFQDDFSPVKV